MLRSFSLRMHFIYPSLGFNGILQYEDRAFDQIWKNLPFFPIVLAHPLYLYFSFWLSVKYMLGPHILFPISLHFLPFFSDLCAAFWVIFSYALFSLLIISIALTAWFNPIGALYFLWFISFLISSGAENWDIAICCSPHNLTDEMYVVCSPLFGIIFHLFNVASSCEPKTQVNARTMTIENILTESSSANQKHTLPTPAVTNTLSPVFLIPLNPLDFILFTVLLMRNHYLF